METDVGHLLPFPGGPGVPLGILPSPQRRWDPRVNPRKCRRSCRRSGTTYLSGGVPLLFPSLGRARGRAVGPKRMERRSPRQRLTGKYPTSLCLGDKPPGETPWDPPDIGAVVTAGRDGPNVGGTRRVSRVLGLGGTQGSTCQVGLQGLQAGGPPDR